jgi:hypothetical protein
MLVLLFASGIQGCSEKNDREKSTDSGSSGGGGSGQDAAVDARIHAEANVDVKPGEPNDAGIYQKGDGSSDSGEADGDASGEADSGPELAWPEITVSDSAYLVIYDDDLADSAAEIAHYRETTEASVTTLSMAEIISTYSDADPSDAIEQAVKNWADGLGASPSGSILLLGDAHAVPPREIEGRSSTVGPSITSDNVYADLDDDGIPDLAIGRIPAKTDKEARVVFDKIVAHESVYEPGPWNKRINLFASEGGFGEFIDQVIEDIALQIIAPLDNAYDISMTYGSPTSEYVYPPEKLSSKVYDRMNEGSLLMAYIGHGYETGFAPMTWNGEIYPIFDTSKLDDINVRHRAPLLAFVACSTAAFDGEEDSIAESILKQSNAPSSVFGATEVSHPYANTVLAREVALNLLQNEPKPATVGELYLRAKQTTISNHDTLRQTIDSLAVALLNGDDPDVLLEEALQMYVLLGDPAMRIVYSPYRATVQTDKTQYAPREVVTVSVDTSGLAEGTALVTLEGARGAKIQAVESVPPDGDPTRDSVIEQNYKNANTKVVDFIQLSFSDSSASAKFVLDADLPANATYYVKVLAQGEQRDAIGMTEIHLGD